ncbi:MAG: molybdenum cofactor guanylyltransferase [Desulfovibrionaceae bacterium]
MTQEACKAAKAPLVGLILAGGLSSRMGVHKPSLKVHGENQPDMLVRTAALLHACVPEVWISCRAGQQVPGYVCVQDVREGLGPIGGIYTALLALQNTAYSGLLALSCDLPFMHGETLAMLVQSHTAAQPLMTTFKQADTGFIEALVAVYHREALPYFQRAVDAGIRQMNKVIPEALRCDIIYQHSDALPFFNINYPADLETARRLIQAL